MKLFAVDYVDYRAKIPRRAVVRAMSEQDALAHWPVEGVGEVTAIAEIDGATGAVFAYDNPAYSRPERCA